MRKSIKGYENIYWIDEYGNIYNKNNLRLKPSLDSKKRYYKITLSKNGVKTNYNIHKLVALHFCEGYDENKVIDHIDDDTLNNHFTKLQWITQKENTHKSYKNMSQIRHYHKCELYDPKNKLIKSFDSIVDCMNYAKTELNLAPTSLQKYYKSKGYYIMKV